MTELTQDKPFADAEAKMPPLDAKRYWTTVALMLTTGIAAFLIANWSMPAKVDEMNASIKELKTGQVSKQDLAESEKKNATYTDARVSKLEGEIGVKLERILAMQETIQENSKESKLERKELGAQISDMKSELVRLKYAVEGKR